MIDDFRVTIRPEVQWIGKDKSLARTSAFFRYFLFRYLLSLFLGLQPWLAIASTSDDKR